ncbi:MAG: hypothetical protein QXF56_00900 [Candidatus Micrarchaeia archaeon]
MVDEAQKREELHKQGELEFSLSMLSEVEWRILTELFSSPYALNTFELYGRMVKRKFNRFYKSNKKIQKLIEQKEYEEASKLMKNKGWEIPSYPRLKRNLEVMHRLGWVGVRIVENKKEGMVWFLPEHVRKKFVERAEKTKNELRKDKKLFQKDVELGLLPAPFKTFKSKNE